jgi:hypothetical protein
LQDAQRKKGLFARSAMCERPWAIRQRKMKMIGGGGLLHSKGERVDFFIYFYSRKEI